MKRILSCFLTVCLLMACVPFGTLSASAADPQRNANGVYEISVEEQLSYVATHPDGDYLLTSDLDLSAETDWSAIGTESAPFSGSFNGAGHTVKVAIDADNTFVGLFGVVSGTVANLTVEGQIKANVNGGLVGAVAAALAGGTIQNCVSYVDIDLTASGAMSAVGGMVGVVISGAAAIRSCTNYGEITADLSATGSNHTYMSSCNNSVGGILGALQHLASADVTQCINAGAISVDENSKASANIGGMVGQISSNGEGGFGYLNLLRCGNKADITVTNFGGERAAGIVGYARQGIIDDCYNWGNIAAYTGGVGSSVSTSGYGTAFGIFGYANLSTTGNPTLEALRCYNASEMPLQGEICVVKGVSRLTAGNYYMSGRTEYSANGENGMAGTPFTGAADLTTKLLAAGEAYIADPAGGYPILAFEEPAALTADGYAVSVEVTPVGSMYQDMTFLVTEPIAAAASDGILTLSLEGRTSLEQGYRLSDLTALEQVNVGGTLYAPDSATALYAVTLWDIPVDAWTAVTVKITSGEDELFSATMNYEDIVEETGVALPFEDLPSYPDGNVSPVYNCGPNLDNDKLSVTDTDSLMVVISGAGEVSYRQYIDRLERMGYTLYYQNETENNAYAYLLGETNNYYIYYTGNAGETRIIQENSTDLDFLHLDTDDMGDAPTEFYQYSIDYTKSEGQTGYVDYWRIDCGMMYILKFADNSLMIIDGGHDRQSSLAAQRAFLEFLYQVTGQEMGMKLRIRGWFFSHAHGDHVYFTHAFLERYHSYVTVEAGIFNIPSYQTMSSGYDSGTFLMKDTINTYYPDAGNVKLHTGEKFSIQGVGFEVIYTHEDAVGANGQTKIGDFNASSTVLRLTIGGKSFIMLGDISDVAANAIMNMYSADYLHTDVVQIAHHGFNDLPTLYSQITAPYVLVPNSYENAHDDNPNKWQGYAKYAEEIYCGGEDTYQITVQNGALNFEALGNYRSDFYFDEPELDSSLIESSVEPKVDLNTVLSGNSLLDQVIDKSAVGTASANTSEDAARLFDGLTTTKYCTKNKPAAVMWKMYNPVTVTGYVVYTGNDNSKNPGRNPKNWLLMGSNDTETWEIIDAVSEAGLPDNDYVGVAFLVDQPQSYRYYVLKMFATDGAEALQISEVALYGTVDEIVTQPIPPAVLDPEVQAIIDAIVALPDYDDMTAEALERAKEIQAAYDALTGNQKVEIDSQLVEKLEQALSWQLPAPPVDRSALEAVLEAIRALPEYDAMTEEALEAAKAAKEAYDALPEELQKEVPAELLEKLEQALIWQLPAPVLLGDMNDDGSLTVADVVLLRRAVLASGYHSAGDMNNDEALTVADVVLLRRAVLAGK